MLKAFYFALFMFFMTLAGVAQANQSSEKKIVAQWVIHNAHPKAYITQEKADRYVDAAWQAGRKHNIDPLLLISKMYTESGFRAKVRNNYDARGLLQVVPRYHRDKIKGRNIFDAYVNSDVAAAIFSEYLNGAKGNFRKALYKYTGGASSKHGKKMRMVYTQLKENILAWKLENNVNIVHVAIFNDPRSYFGTTNAVPPPTDTYAAKQERLDRLVASL